MPESLNKKTDYDGYAHLDDIKRELLTGKFRREATDWNVETFMSIGAFDDKDRFEFLVATDLNLSVINSSTVPFKIRYVQGHQERFLKDRNPAIGAIRVFCNPEHKGRYSNRLTEYDTNGMPPRRSLLLYHEHPFEFSGVNPLSEFYQRS